MKQELDVVAALIKKDDKILLCQRNEGDRFGLLWEFPGGTVEEDEDLSRAIEREIKEELGLDIKADKLLNEFYDEDETLKIKVHLFRCFIQKGEPQAIDCRDFGFFSFNEIEELNLAPADKKIFGYLKGLSF